MPTGIVAALLCAMSVLVVCPLRASAVERFDIVIKSGRIVDGSGSPWYRGDVGIRDGKIVKIGRIDASRARKVIDAKGLIVAPGFVDMMGQTATPVLRDPRAGLNLLRQGITTINTGEGVSAAPLSAADARYAGWQSMAEYFQLLDLKGLPVNVAQTVGHTQVRRLVIGDVDRRPTPEELARMQALVRESMQAGATGVSTALIYPPAVYATTEEIAALCKVAGESGGRYYTHMRNEGDQLLEAIDEALEIGAAGGTPVHIFHLKAAGRQNWGKIQLAIARIKAARATGQQVTADIYPYINNGLGIAAFIHPRHFSRGRDSLRKRLGDANLRKQIRREMQGSEPWENWYRHTGNDWSKVVVGSTTDPRYAKLAGRDLAAISKTVGEDPWDTFFNLATSGAFVMPESMTEANKIRLMREEFISFCTDVGPAGGGSTRIASHPRGYGSFPRLLARYVRDQGVISLERAIAQASAVATKEIMAYDRGTIAVGLAADIIVFDYENLTERATFAKPDQLADGMRYVIVNGETVLSEGEITSNRPGCVLRGPGHKPESAPSKISAGQSPAELQSFDSMMTEFMKEHHIPGASLAVTDGGRLVFAKGYGYADVAAREPVKPTSLFRIASISKPITAAAILKLVEQKKLSLADRVFDILKFEPHFEEGAKFDERQREITIHQLLQHRGGWDRNESFDAMFQSVRFARALDVDPPASPEHIIRCMLGLPLDFDPGERYAYSNYGYCLLGRVIEELTGKSYEESVGSLVLKPLEITAMRIGKSRLEGRHLPNEVRYYDPNLGTSVFAKDLGRPLPEPYGGWYLEAMDAHGAWIASAVDLARFACALEKDSKQQALSDHSLAAMHERPPGRAGHDEDGKPTDTYYSLGWMNRDVGGGRLSHWHTGSLGGTATILIRRHDGKNFIALFNARGNAKASHFGSAIDPLLHRAANEVTSWPEIDLFDEF